MRYPKPTNNHSVAPQSYNQYCFCHMPQSKGRKCLICSSLEKGKDFRTVNRAALEKYSVVITGTNGKSTVTNIIGNTLAQVYGSKVSHASSTGVYVGGKRIINIEHKASEHYVYLLNQNKQEIVISEQPQAGLFLYGLPVTHNFGIILNITEDHLETSWIHSGQDDLAAIKSLIVKMATEGCAISADYPWTRKIIETHQNRKIFIFSRKKDLVDIYRKKYVVCSELNGRIVIFDGSQKINLGKINDFKLTLGGILDYNVENILAIICLFYNSLMFKSDFDKLIKILKESDFSFDANPSRFNLFAYKSGLVVFDYAHNIDGYKKTIASLDRLKRMLNKNIVGLVAVADDRSKDMVTRLAKYIKSHFDKVYVRFDRKNQNSALLATLIGRGSEWTEGYSDFIQKKAKKDNIVYITLAGRGHLEDAAKTIKRLNLKTIGISELHSLRKL